MSDHEESEAGYGLVMPFVVCASKGGPYDDASFVAGVWFGKLDAQLTHAAEAHTLPTLDFPIPTPLVPQLDLLAMHHGFTMDSEPWDEAPDPGRPDVRQHPPPRVHARPVDQGEAVTEPVDVDQLRQLHEAATDAPWAWEATGEKDNSWGVGVVSDDDGNLLAGNIEPGEHEVIDPVCEAIDGNQADAALIVAMRNQLGALLDAYGELTGLRAENERLSGEVHRLDRALSDWSKEAHDAGALMSARLAVAHDVIRRLRNGWKPDLGAGLWWRGDLRVSWPMTDAEKRAMLDAAAGPDDTPKLDLGGSARCVECDTPHRFGERCASEETRG